MPRYAKALVAVLTAALIALQEALPLTGTASTVVTVALATLGAIAVYVVPNDTDPA